MGHTPGPWVVRHPMDDEHAEIYAEAGGALVAWPTDNNANLIAAAPDLLAALQEAVTALNVKEKFPVYDTDSYAIAARCDKAIAKAEGRSE